MKCPYCNKLFNNSDIVKNAITPEWKTTNQIGIMAEHSNPHITTLPILNELFEEGLIEKQELDNITLWRIKP